MKSNWFADGMTIFSASVFTLMGAFALSFPGSTTLGASGAVIFGLVMYAVGLLFTIFVAHFYVSAFYVWHTRTMPPWGVVVYDNLLFVTLTVLVVGGYLIYNTDTHQGHGLLLCMIGADALIGLLLWHWMRRECKSRLLPTTDSYGDVH